MKYEKYPRTLHLPSSPGGWREVVVSTGDWRQQVVVITEKMDGENTTIYSDGWCHARSIHSRWHDSRWYVRQLAQEIAQRPDEMKRLPEGLRLCGENVYAAHGITYSNLASWFQVFAAIAHNDKVDNKVLSWPDTEYWCQWLGLVTVPLLYEGVWPGEQEAIRIWRAETSDHESEGFVVRPQASYPLRDHGQVVAKWVRVQSQQEFEAEWSWFRRQVRVNGLRQPAAF